MALVKLGDSAIDWTFVYAVEIYGFEFDAPARGSLKIYAHFPGAVPAAEPYMELTDYRYAKKTVEYVLSKKSGLTSFGTVAIDLKRINSVQIKRRGGDGPNGPQTTAEIGFTLGDKTLIFPIQVETARELLKWVETQTPNP